MAGMCNVDRARKVVGSITITAILYNIPRFLEIINTEKAPKEGQLDKYYIMGYKTWSYCVLYAIAPLMTLLVMLDRILLNLNVLKLFKVLDEVGKNGLMNRTLYFADFECFYYPCIA